MAMWQMHRPWARRTVAPEGGQTPFPLGFAPGPPHYWPRYFLLSQLARPFALCPLRIALDLRRCDHVYPRWGGHNPSSRARLTGSLIGSELPIYRTPALRFAPPGAPPRCPTAFSYVHYEHSHLVHKKPIIPDDMGIPLLERITLSGWGYTHFHASVNF